MNGSSSKSKGVGHSDILVAVALLLLAAVFAYLGFSQPKVSNDYTVSETQTQVYSPSFDSDTAVGAAAVQSDNDNSENSYVNEVNSTTPENEQTVSDSSVSFPINLNTCTKEELMAIDGIGDVRAEAILAYREQLGGYTSVEQLKDISGIGDVLYSKIAPYVFV